MTDRLDNITVQVKYKDVEKTFSGNLEEVWLSLNKFFNEFLPTFEIAKKLVLEVDLQKLVKECENIIAFAEEGSYLLIPRNKLTDNETLALLLLAGHLEHALGKTEKDSLSKDELQMKLGKDAKITSTRLGELIKNEVVAKTADERYRITTFGVARVQKDILPRIRARVAG